MEVVGLGERPDRLSGIELTELVDRVERAEAAGDEHADYGLIAVKWAADVQLRICSNSFFWAEFRKRVGPRPLSGKAGASELVYAITEHETVVLAPRALYEDIRATRAALARCRTWGDARARLSADRLAELRELAVAPADPEPADDAPLDTDTIAGGCWPSLWYGAMADWLPEAVVHDFGTEYSTMLDSGVNFDAQSVRALLAALREVGFSCHRRPQLAELFDDHR